MAKHLQQLWRPLCQPHRQQRQALVDAEYVASVRDTVEGAAAVVARELGELHNV